MKKMNKLKKLNKLKLCMTAGILLLAGGYVLLCSRVDMGRILPNTTVNGVSLDGMTQEEAEQALKKDAEARRSAAVFTALFQEKEYTIKAADALEMDYVSAAGEALLKNQVGFAARGMLLLQSSFRESQSRHPLVIKDTALLHEAVADSGILEVEDAPRRLYKIKDGRLFITAGTVTETIDEEDLIEKITAAVAAEDYKSALQCRTVTMKTEKPDIDEIYQSVHTEAADAALDPENHYEIVESVTGVDFDKKSAEEALDKAETGSTISVDLVYEEPEVTTRKLKQNLFSDVLSTYKTNVSGTSNRLTNIRLAAEKCNGAILPAGGEFSFNDAVGEQTAARGFKTASAIKDGEIIQAYGGGICQVSSTIFAAALYADLTIVERWNHTYASKYIAPGLDAAVAWDELDFRIANSTAYPVRIDTACEDGWLTVTIRGTRTDDSSVEIETVAADSSSEDVLEVKTYRKVYNGDKSQFFIEKAAHSEYAVP